MGELNQDDQAKIEQRSQQIDATIRAIKVAIEACDTSPMATFLALAFLVGATRYLVLSGEARDVEHIRRIDAMEATWRVMGMEAASDTDAAQSAS